MPGITIRIPFAISLLLTLLLVVFASKSPTYTSHTESPDAAISEQSLAVAKGASAPAISQASQVSASGADPLIEMASRSREPLMLLILGAALLSIATGMRLLLWRKSGKTSGLQPHDK